MPSYNKMTKLGGNGGGKDVGKGGGRGMQNILQNLALLQGGALNTRQIQQNVLHTPSTTFSTIFSTTFSTKICHFTICWPVGITTFCWGRRRLPFENTKTKTKNMLSARSWQLCQGVVLIALHQSHDTVKLGHKCQREGQQALKPKAPRKAKTLGIQTSGAQRTTVIMS